MSERGRACRVLGWACMGVGVVCVAWEWVTMRGRGRAWRVRGWPCVDVVGRGMGVGVDVGSDSSLQFNVLKKIQN